MGDPLIISVVPAQTLNRLRTLEDAMASMAAAVERTSHGLDRLEREMREFKEEMGEFKGEMLDFKEETRRDRRELNKKLGEIANKQGRLVEDLVAPSVPSVFRQIAGLPEDAPLALSTERLRLRPVGDPSRMRELDVVAAHDGLGLVVEVKSVLGPEQVSAFAASLPDARDILAPLGVREVIGAVATLHADPSIVTHASRLGLYVLAVGDEMLEPKNAPGFTPRRFR